MLVNQNVTYVGELDHGTAQVAAKRRPGLIEDQNSIDQRRKIYFPREIIMNSTHIQADGHGNNLHVLDILNEMRRTGLESIFICTLMENCQRYEGIRELMEIWFD